MILCTVKDSVIQLITVTLIFAFVLAITYFTTRWIGSYQKKRVSYGNIKIIESLNLSGNKILEVVKVGNKCFLIAVCKDTVTTIGEVDENTMELKDDTHTGRSESFGNIFARFKVVNDGKKNQAETDGTSDTGDVDGKETDNEE